MNPRGLIRLTAERNAHVAAALEARRTSHVWAVMARDWPEDAERYRREANKCRERARWNITKARGLDAWIEWKRAHGMRKAA